MPTPLYDALIARADRGTARFHMPGHKGHSVTPGLADAARIDFTELPDTGNLYDGDDVIAAAEELWARAWGASACQFLTGGSTQGLHAALLLAARRGRGVLVDRACHRSVYHGMGLWDLEPVYLPRRQTQPVDPAAVETALNAHPEIKTVCITSPTYYGVLSDVQAISDIAHRRGAELLVDGAHGAHLPFLGVGAFTGADLVVASAHKTLPVYGQGALLFGAGYPARALREAAMVTGTSSPSYPVMASMDWARAWMEAEGRARYEDAVRFVEHCRKKFPALTGPRLDPARLTLRAADGFAVKGALEDLGVAAEMADRDHVVFIVTGADDPADWARLEKALEGLDLGTPPEAGAGLPPEPEMALSPREALLARGREMSLRAAEGLVCRGMVAPYPPGVPVIAPGERITKKCLAYLEKVGYNVDTSASVWEDGPMKTSGDLP